MRISLKNALVLSCGLLAVAGPAVAKGNAAANGDSEKPRIVYFPAQGVDRGVNTDQHLVAKATNITFHGGPVITSAKVVFIFWGPSFANAASADHAYATTLQSFRNQFGTTGEYNTITQYSGIQLANLGSGTADFFDTATPPTNVTDSAVQGEVNKYLQTHTKSTSAIYEVVIPSTSFSSSGSSTSCGGPSLAYCAYHSWIGSGSSATKYSIQPFPSCSGCKVSGWSNVQNQEHFVTHETREAVTDPTGTGWFDSSGQEADDKCAWSPTPFFGTGGFGYQYEWSNANGGCIRTR
ncbi:MAG: hypothetical protein QOJ16_4456 [Acidobacteriota bacterium]|jgi:hypothetical protein|nr:hypothetical protein [Acidobacteriota bacterium]